MKKKVLALFLTTTLTASMLCGCGDSGSSKESSAEGQSSDSGNAQNVADSDSTADSGSAGEDSDDIITLTVVDWESDEMNAKMQEAFDNVFSKEHPNIKVEIVKGSYSDWGQQMRSMIQAGDAPDIFQMGYDGANEMYLQGSVYDWTEKLAADQEFASGFYPGTLEGWQYDGRQYGFPSLVNVYGVFYNKDLLDAAGLPYPESGWTWDDLWEYGEKLKDPDNGRYGFYNFDSGVFGISLISVSNGGEPFVPDMTHTTEVVVDDKFKETAHKMADLIKTGVIPPRTYDAGTAGVQALFEQGEIALMYYGQWEVDGLIRNYPDLNWGYVATPRGTACAATTYDTTGWVSPKNMKHPEETWELMKFITGDVYQETLKVTPVASCANLSASEAFFDAMRESGHPDAAEAVQEMLSTEKKTAVRFAGDWRSDASKQYEAEMNNFLDGKGDDSILDVLAERVNNIIDAY